MFVCMPLHTKQPVRFPVLGCWCMSLRPVARFTSFLLFDSLGTHPALHGRARIGLIRQGIQEHVYWTLTDVSQNPKNQPWWNLWLKYSVEIMMSNLFNLHCDRFGFPSGSVNPSVWQSCRKTFNHCCERFGLSTIVFGDVIMEKSQRPSAGSKPEQREDPVTSQDFMHNVWDVYSECVCVCVSCIC